MVDRRAGLEDLGLELTTRSAISFRSYWDETDCTYAVR